MKQKLFFLGMVVVLASCKSYQMSTVSSVSTPQNDSTGVISVVNDSLAISYNFSGKNAPLHVEILNKLDEPLYISWEKSALIIEDQAYSFVNDVLKITGEASSTTYDYNRIFRDLNNTKYTDGSFDANVKLSKNESFIPPHSKVTRTIYALNLEKVAKVDKAGFKPTYVNLSDGTGQIRASVMEFSKENSPLQFKSYMTLYTVKNNQPHLFNHQQDFFISSVVRSSANPKNVFEFYKNPGNVIVSSKTTGYGKVMTGVAVAGVVVGASALSDTESRER